MHAILFLLLLLDGLRVCVDFFVNNLLIATVEMLLWCGIFFALIMALIKQPRSTLTTVNVWRPNSARPRGSATYTPPDTDTAITAQVRAYVAGVPGTLTVRSHLLFTPPSKPAPEFREQIEDWARVASGSGIGDARLRVGGMCFQLSGDRTVAKLRRRAKPYTSWAGHYHDPVTPAELRELVVIAAQNDVRVCVLADQIANVDAVLTAFEVADDQVGIRDAKDRLYVPSHAEAQTRTAPLVLPNDPPFSPDDGANPRAKIQNQKLAAFPSRAFRMIDQIDVLLPDGGPQALGFIQGSTRQTPMPHPRCWLINCTQVSRLAALAISSSLAWSVYLLWNFL